MTGLVLLAHSVKWDLENLGSVRIKLRALCVRSSGKRRTSRECSQKVSRVLNQSPEGSTDSCDLE